MGISLNEQRRLRFSLHNFFKLVAPLFGSNHQLAKRIEYLGQIWRDPAKRHRRDTLIHAGRRLHTDYLWLFRTQFSSKVWNSQQVGQILWRAQKTARLRERADSWFGSNFGGGNCWKIMRQIGTKNAAKIIHGIFSIYPQVEGRLLFKGKRGYCLSNRTCC